MPQDDVGTIELDKNDILDIINDDADEQVVEEKQEEPKKEKEELEEGEEEKKEEEEDEDEEEEPTYDDDKIDIIAPARRKEILAKYPKLFKEFPHLERAYYRDQQYGEILGTPEDAKQVVDTAHAFEQYSNRLMSGSTQEVLKAVKDSNPEAFSKVVDNYLFALKEVDDKAFYHVVGNTIKSTVAAMVQEAQRSNSEDLMNAARLLHQFVMGNSEWTPVQTYSKEKPKEEKEQESQLQNERAQFFYDRFETTQSDLQTRVDGVLRNTIDQNMDPKGSMTNYVKRVAVNEAMENVTKSIVMDTQFRRLLDRLWERAAENNFSKPSVEKIRSAYLAKAKTLLPEHIKKSRNSALAGLGKRVRDEGSEYRSNNSSNNSTRKTSPPSTIRGSNSKENPSKGKSTLQFLNED